MKNINITKIIAYTVVFTAVASAAHAGSTTGMPWEAPLTTIANSISGPVVKVICLLGICGAAAGMMIGEHGNGFKLMLKIVMGGSIALGASSFMSNLFGYSGGAAF